MTKEDGFKSPEQLRAEWLGQENEWCNKQPWRPLNAHVEAVAGVIRCRKIEDDCLQVLESIPGGSRVFKMVAAWNLLVEKKDGLKLLTSLCRTTLSDLIADSFNQNKVRDAHLVLACPIGISEGNLSEVKSQLLLSAAELMAYKHGFGGGLVGA